MDIRKSCREKNGKKKGPADVRNIDRKPENNEIHILGEEVK